MGSIIGSQNVSYHIGEWISRHHTRTCGYQAKGRVALRIREVGLPLQARVRRMDVCCSVPVAAMTVYATQRRLERAWRRLAGWWDGPPDRGEGDEAGKGGGEILPMEGMRRS